MGCSSVIRVHAEAAVIPAAGREVLGRMRTARCKQVPVVVLTSSDSQKDRDEAINLGASRYFQKPSRLSEFLKMGSIFREMLGGSAD